MWTILLFCFVTYSIVLLGFSELKQFVQTENTKLAQASIVKAENGVVNVKDSFDLMNSLGDDYFEGGLIGSLIGILGGPLGVLFGFATGGAIGASVGSDKELINSALITTVSKKLTNGEVAIIALVQENDESVLNAIFEKYQVDIARWDVATVAAEIESALKIQEDLEHQAKARLIADKKEARREKFDKLKASIKEKFSKKN
ncbi:DUF1269 domain-containing protein [Streptococcus parasanguinis]|uniref:DUF1269 domain-containing protein n=1 Tax=Streptococcus rubneri TaxID=1234680 RepID=A0A4Z1DUA4_9STRE|nr:DUF1269 domain-containing family protein [Streptococcus rubneri]MBT0924626.1 DUF1269 domain-containing protein [Streptococcus parasanguinis]MBZ2116715.1 DUF1269 domain-containing protein [Streptococcus gordonii]OFN90422.1 hypothetical protein HMPREF2686_01145 [Streptococcus sp. HMSC057G03]RHK67418.1 DUF1269 domain-containing protein [Streptococcus parasanguinis]